VNVPDDKVEDWTQAEAQFPPHVNAAVFGTNPAAHCASACTQSCAVIASANRALENFIFCACEEPRIDTRLMIFNTIKGNGKKNISV
jgi:hypothetical protein